MILNYRRDLLQREKKTLQTLRELFMLHVTRRIFLLVWPHLYKLKSPHWYTWCKSRNIMHMMNMHIFILIAVFRASFILFEIMVWFFAYILQVVLKRCTYYNLNSFDKLRVNGLYCNNWMHYQNFFLWKSKNIE